MNGKTGVKLEGHFISELDREVKMGICRYVYRKKQENQRFSQAAAKLTSAHVTWQDGVKHTQDQNTSAEGLLFDIPKQGSAESLKDVVHIK
jgi:hypothetical protein